MDILGLVGLILSSSLSIPKKHTEARLSVSTSRNQESEDHDRFRLDIARNVIFGEVGYKRQLEGGVRQERYRCDSSRSHRSRSKIFRSVVTSEIHAAYEW